MRSALGVAVGVVLLFGGASVAAAGDEPLSACFYAVGTFLTTNLSTEDGSVVGRSLISLTNGGHVFLTDSNEGGTTEFASFTDGGGSWRCVSDETSGELRIRASVLDFTHHSAAHPQQMIARLDYDARYEADSDTISADVMLYFMPIEANPMDAANLKDGIGNTITGIRVAAH